MIDLQVTKHELILLTGLVGATSGDNLNLLYKDLMKKLAEIDPTGELKWMANTFTEEIADILRGKQVNEDKLFDEVYKQFLERWGGR